MPSVEDILAARQAAAADAKRKRDKLVKDEADKKQADKFKREEAEAREIVRQQQARADARKKEKDDAEAAEKAAEQAEERRRAIARGERVDLVGSGSKKNGKGVAGKQYAHMKPTSSTSSKSSSSRLSARPAQPLGTTAIPVQLTREEQRRIAEQREFGVMPDRSGRVFDKTSYGKSATNGSSGGYRLSAPVAAKKPAASGSVSSSTNGKMNGSARTSLTLASGSAIGAKTLGSGIKRDVRSISDLVMGQDGSRSGSEDLEDGRSPSKSDFFALPGSRNGGASSLGTVSRTSMGAGSEARSRNGTTNAQGGPSRLRNQNTPDDHHTTPAGPSKAPKSIPSAKDSLGTKHGVIAGNARKRDLPSDSDDLDGDSDSDGSEEDTRRSKGRTAVHGKKARVEGLPRERSERKQKKGGGGGILASLGFDPWGGRDSTKYYARDINSDDEDMEADAIQIQREETRAARQAREDDRREEAKEKHRMEEKRKMRAGGAG